MPQQTKGLHCYRGKNRRELRLNRHYRNVHKDVTALMEWTVIEKNDAGLVFVPWDEIDVRWQLQVAA